MFLRRNYFIDKELQGKFVVTVLSLILLITVISMCNMVVLTGFFVNQQEISFQDASTTEVLLSAVKVLWPRLALLFMINIVIVCVVCIMYSHQIAGPAFNLGRACRELAKGDLTQQVFLRKNDHLQEIAGNVNLVIRNLQNALQNMESQHQSIGQILSDLHSKKPEPPLLEAIEKMKGHHHNVLEQLARFQIHESDELGEKTLSEQNPDDSESQDPS